MSVTHPTPVLEATHYQGVASDRQQLMPALVAVAIAGVTIVISLLITGLPY